MDTYVLTDFLLIILQKFQDDIFNFNYHKNQY